jgi:UDP-N-acetylglucosamine acyltransferase
VIDPRAVIDPKAEIDEGVKIGPFSVIGPDVRIGAGSEIASHVVIRGPTSIGRDNRIFQFASVGEEPQDKKYAGEPTRLEIGDRNVLREYVTIHRGTVQDQGLTRIGSDCLIMAYCHVAHDCMLGDHVIMANGASMAGHVKIGDWAILGGFSLIHQFCRIGAHSLLAFGAGISMDVPPFVTVGGHPAKPYSINAEGLRRRQFGDQKIQVIRRAFKLLYKQSLKLDQAIAAMQELLPECPELQIMIDFLRESGRGITR